MSEGSQINSAPPPNPAFTTTEWYQLKEPFRLFIECVQDYAIFMLDPDGYVRTWNVGAERIKGYKAAQIIGQHFSRFYPEEDIRSGKPAWELEVAKKEGRFEDEGWRLRKDGSRFWANVVITPIKDSSGTLLGFSKVTRDFTERMTAQKALEDSQRKLKESELSLRNLSLHLLRTQDEERRRIGREIHDSVGQYLAALRMKLDTMSAAPAENDLDECGKLVDECVKEVRTISYLLYPPMLEEMGLKSAIPWYLNGFSERSGIATTFNVPDDFQRLSRDAELVLFRVLQEALTNVQRHSGIRGDFRDLLPGGKLFVTEAEYQVVRDQHLPKLKEVYRHYFARTGVAAIVFPATMIPPPLIGEDVDVSIGSKKVPFETAVARNIAPGSTAGLPGLVLAAGMTSGGLPIALEFDSQAGSDRSLLALGLSLERVLGAIPSPTL